MTFYSVMIKQYLILLGFFVASHVAFLQLKKAPSVETHTAILRGDIAVVDRQRVLKDLPALRKMRLKLEEHLKLSQDKFAHKEQDLRLEYQSILDEEATPKDYDQALAVEEKRKVFKQSVLEVQKSADLERKKLQEAYEKVMSSLYKYLDEVIKKLALERQIECVIERSQAAFYNVNKDLTSVALERLTHVSNEVDLEV